MRKLTLLFVFLLTSLAGYAQDDATLISTGTTTDGKTVYHVQKGDLEYEIVDGNNFASLSRYCGIGTLTDLTGIATHVTYQSITYPVTTVANFIAIFSLVTVTLPEGITTIHNYAFMACPELVSVTLPSTVTTIEQQAFANCPKLEITIGANVTTISGGACAGVKTISVDNNNSKYYSRDNCLIETSTNKLIGASISTNSIPSSVTCLGANSFYGYTGTSIEIPNNIETIEEGIFSWSQITSVIIPASVKKIEGYLSGDNLTSITVDANNPIYDSRNNCNAIIETKTNKLISGCVNTTIPDGVTTIGRFALFDYQDDFTIPGNVASIEEFAFARKPTPTTPLTKVKSKILNPYPIPTSVFCSNDGVNFPPLTGVTLKVPKGTKDKYAATAGWNVITTIEEDDALGTVSTSTTDEVNYVEKADQTVAIVSNESANASVEIPDAVGGKEVSEIGANAFVGMTTVTDIYLPETEEKLELGINALKIDDDHIATVHVPLSLLMDYALDEQLKQNYEAGKVVASVTAPNKYWTFSSGVDVLVPEGVSVYICKSVNGSDITIVELTDADLNVNGKKVIKANNGVLISSVSGNAYNIVANSGNQASGSTPATTNANSYEGNKLEPVIVSKHYEPSEYYMLYNGGFISITDGDASKTPACKALLKK